MRTKKEEEEYRKKFWEHFDEDHCSETCAFCEVNKSIDGSNICVECLHEQAKDLEEEEGELK